MPVVMVMVMVALTRRTLSVEQLVVAGDAGVFTAGTVAPGMVMMVMTAVVMRRLMLLLMV